ncbi:hypothetical protein FJ365_00065 [Candidatus Dependentiae bacterium]|nr:hypothetical protein [Candidatus Dependentiae bacterium]
MRSNIIFLLLCMMPALSAATPGKAQPTEAERTKEIVFTETDLRRHSPHNHITITVSPAGQAKNTPTGQTTQLNSCCTVTAGTVMAAEAYALYQCPCYCLICNGALGIYCCSKDVRNCSHDF